MKLPSTKIVSRGKIKINHCWLGFLIEMNNIESMEMHEIGIGPITVIWFPSQLKFDGT